MTRGLWITLEGGDGVGKTTQARDLAEALRARGHDATLHHEPSEPLRALLLTSDAEWPPRAEACLFLASQARALAQVIRPALDKGEVIICDRFVDSVFAYQGGGRAIDVEAAAAFALGDARPDLTLWLDMPVEQALARAKPSAAERKSAYFTEGLARAPEGGPDVAFQQRVRDAYAQIARAEPKRVVAVDASRSRADVAEAVLAAALERLS